MSAHQRQSSFRLCNTLKVGLAVIFASVPALSPAQMQSGSADEYEIRAAMLLNIARFVDWPPWKFDTEHSDFLICVFGADPIDAYAARYLKHQVVSGKQTRFVHIDAIEDASRCHVLYTSPESRRQAEKAGAELEKNAVLTVSECPTATSPGQVVGLPSVDEHVKIEVNLGIAQRSQLQISSRLLNIAKVSR